MDQHGKIIFMCEVGIVLIIVLIIVFIIVDFNATIIGSIVYQIYKNYKNEPYYPHDYELNL